jgi:MFS family permease
MSAVPASAPGDTPVFIKLLPITLAVFIGFLTIALPLPVLPLYVRDTLGMSPLMVGAIMGASFLAALLSRTWSGAMADTRGAKRAAVAGFALSALPGLAYLASQALDATQAVWMLLAGRLVLGCGESLVLSGAMGWGMRLAGPRNAGKVMVWIGTAIYGAYAIGAPAGMAIYARSGLTGISIATFLIPLLALGMVARLQAVAPTASHSLPFYKLLGAVWLPGLGLALSSAGFGVITAFISLLFAGKEWSNASLAFTSFGVAFIGARICFGHLPDRLGGARVALVCVVIEAVGQYLIWGADHPYLAYLGAALTGFGYSLAFPGFGIEAVKRAPPQNRAAAMGAYVAFLDLSLGITGPAAGALATHSGIASVYLAGTVAVLGATLVAGRLLMRRPEAARL